MEKAKQKDLFCILCKLQFGKKLVFDLHLSLVHGKKVEIKTEAKSNLSESELNEDTTTKKGHGAQLVMEGLELWQKNSEFFVQKSVIS